MLIVNLIVVEAYFMISENGNNSKADVETETPILWPRDVKS